MKAMGQKTILTPRTRALIDYNNQNTVLNKYNLPFIMEDSSKILLTKVLKQDFLTIEISDNITNTDGPEGTGIVFNNDTDLTNDTNSNNDTDFNNENDKFKLQNSNGR